MVSSLKAAMYHKIAIRGRIAPAADYYFILPHMYLHSFQVPLKSD